MAYSKGRKENRMPEEDPEGQSESGGSLRSKLEASIAENRQLAGELRGFKVTQEIAAKGYKHVTAEDLKDVNLADLSKVMAEVEETKGKQRETVLRQVFAEQGLDEEAVEEAVSRLLAPKEESHSETSARIAGLGRLAGTFPNAHEDDQLTGPALIAAALNKPKNAKS